MQIKVTLYCCEQFLTLLLSCGLEIGSKYETN